ncbi:MAG: hypothetical protein COB53_03790 [Elusimicrobia bacterium]|nr:MAG: hypothetical protein COB53_03790 [Elusimicrobiota bacterium]
MFIAKIEQLLRGESKHKEPNANAGTSLVLHIEDDDAWAELVRLWLSNKGSAVHRVSNRMQMRRFLSQITQIPDCIIMDIELDSTDGLQLCDELKENSRFQKIPLLIFSGRENMQLPGLKHMAVTVIQKRPEAADELMAAVKSVLAQQERTLGVLEVGTLRLDPRGTSPIVFDEDEQLCTLDRGLFSILRCLVEASPAAVADAELRRVSMRREDYRRRHSEDPAPKTVGSYVYELRRHLGRKVARRIVRIHGLGYAYVPPGGDE